MCKSEITLCKFLKLLLEFEFYKIVIHLAFVTTDYIHFSFIDFMWFLVPIHNVTDDFVACYLVFFLFIPFLNVLIGNLSQSQHLLLILLCVGLYSIWNTLPNIGVGTNDSIWFCILYAISSYLRLYPLKKDKDNGYWLWLMSLSIGLAVLSVLLILWLSQYGLSLEAYTAVGWPNSPLALIVSICAFMFFKGLKMKQSRFINIVGGGTFGVLLIHANNDTMRQWLWRDVFDNAGHYVSNAIYLHAILVPIIVFVVCSAIEYVRMKTVEKPILNFTYNLVQKQYQKSVRCRKRT